MNFLEIIKEYIVPLISAILGGGLSFYRSRGDTKNSEVNVENVLNVSGDRNRIINQNYINNSKTVTHKYYGKQKSDHSVGIVLFVFGIIALLFLAYQYSMYAPVIFIYLEIFVKSAIFFSFLYVFAEVIFGKSEYFKYLIKILFSAVILGYCYFYGIEKLVSGYRLFFRENAIRYGVMGYVKYMDDNIRLWIFSQIFGLLFFVVSIFMAVYFICSKSFLRIYILCLFSVFFVVLSGLGASGYIHPNWWYVFLN